MNFEQLRPRKDSLGLLILLGMVLWFSHEMIWDGKVPFFRDMGTYFYPMRFALAESFKAGELPLWDRHIAMGFPLLADFQSGAFYPPHLLYFFLPFFAAVRILFVLHYLVAATGGYFLCRRWGFPPYLAIVGGILFTFGGMIVSLTNLLNHFQAAVWLPWVLFFGERYLQVQRRKHFLEFTLVLLLQFLAGSPEFYLMTTVLLFLDSLRVKTAGSGISYHGVFFGLAAANGLVAALSMVQVLPTVELLLESRGRRSILYPEATLWSLHPSNLINLFFFDKEVDTQISGGINLFFARDIPFLVSHYLGVASFFGICFFLFYSSRKEKVITLGLTAISLILALGKYTPLYPFLFQYIPLVSLFRFPEKFFFLTCLLLLFMTLRGLVDFLESDSFRSRGPFLILATICILAFASYLFLLFDSGFLSGVIARATGYPLPSTATTTAAVLLHFERQVALIIGMSFLFFLWRRGSLRPALFKSLLVTIVFLDLSLAHRSYQFLLSPNDLVFNNPRIIQSPAPLSRLFYHPTSSNLHPNYFSISRQPIFGEVYSVLFSNLLPNTGVFHGFDYMQEIDALPRWPYVVFLRAANTFSPYQLSRLLGSLNVEYVNSFKPLPTEGITLVHYFAEYPSWLYKIERVIPRAYIVSNSIVEKDPEKILKGISTVKFDPLRDVILDEPLSIPSNKDFRGQAVITTYSNQSVTIHTSLNGPGILVLADSYYPGWRAYVDGRETKILRANLFFRAVTLSQGDHLVEFHYRPLSFTIGLALSLVTLCGLLFLGSKRTVFRERRGLPV